MKLTRQQLYDMVWAEPVTKVAAKIGLSDRGRQVVRSIRHPRCQVAATGRGRRLGTRAPNSLFRHTPNLHTAASKSTSHLKIPTSGRKMNPPNCSAGGAATREQGHGAGEQPPDAPARKDYICRAPRRQGPMNTAGFTAPRGRWTSACRADASPVPFGLLSPPARPGGPRPPGEDVRWQDLRGCARGADRVGLDERTAQEKRDLSAEEKRKVLLGEYVYRRRTYHATGELSITLRSVWGIRHRWADRKKARLEDMLNDVIVSMILVAENETTRRLERERRERELREADRLRQQEAARLHEP